MTAIIVEMGRDPLVGYNCHQCLGPAPVRRLAGDQPVQFPRRPDRRSGRAQPW